MAHASHHSQSPMCKTHYLNVVGVGLDVSFGPDLEKNQICVFPSRAELLGQLDQTEMFGNMKCLNLGRLPGEIVAMSRRSLAAKYIDAQCVSRLRWPRIDRRKRNAHGRAPYTFLPIDLR